MGLGNNGTSGSVTFVQINGGRFKVKAEENAPGAVERVKTAGPQAGQSVWEYVYGELSGHIVEIGSKELPNDYGHVLEVTLQDDGGKYKLSLPYYKSQAIDFLKRLPNVNPSEAVQLSVWNTTKDDITRTVFNVKQKDQSGNWVTVPMKWTKGNEGDLPQWTSFKKAGKTIWDNTEQFDYLITNVALTYQHTLKDAKLPDFASAASQPAPQPAPQPAGQPDPLDGGDDDLPF